jgi:transcriptional regulator with XRE-family HTH domain
MAFIDMLPSHIHRRCVSDTLAVIPIGTRIGQLLDGINRTAGWLAETAGLERSTVLRAIKGERQPTADTLAVIAPVLGVTLAQLVAGTDAAARVRDVEELIPRRHYDAAVREVLAYEARANETATRAREFEEALQQERSKARAARAEAEGLRREVARLEAERNDAQRTAAACEHDARRYREGLEKAVKDVAHLKEQVRELGQAVEDGRRTGRITAILASAAAVASVAQYLRSDAERGTRPEDEPAPRPARKRRRESGARARPDPNTSGE